MRLSELLRGLDARTTNSSDPDITGLTCDSRSAREGDLFVAIPGTHADGHHFISDAVNRGCAAVVAERVLSTPNDLPYVVCSDSRIAFGHISSRFFGNPTSRMNVIGVTGTNGKTTTTFLVKSILQAAGERVGCIGTVQYQTGGRTIDATQTTPGSDLLQSLFAEMVLAGCRSTVMEVSSHALAQKRVHGVRYAAAIFTNLTRDHLDYHPTLEDYFQAKCSLFEMLPAHGVAVLNQDDPMSVRIAEAAGARVIRYSIRRKADISARLESSTLDGSTLLLRLGTYEARIQTRLIGRHNASNIAAAAACTWAMGYDPEPIRAGIETMEEVPGRLERVDDGGGPVVLVDYAHTEDALRNVLSAIRPLTHGKVIVVFGCGGDRDRGKRPLMGQAAEELADQVVLTSDNPRSEDPTEIIHQIESGLRTRDRAISEPDRELAIRKAISLAREGDVVLIAGKGHETYQLSREGTRPFDDREIARRYLGKPKRAPG